MSDHQRTPEVVTSREPIDDVTKTTQSSRVDRLEQSKSDSIRLSLPGSGEFQSHVTQQLKSGWKHVATVWKNLVTLSKRGMINYTAHRSLPLLVAGIVVASQFALAYVSSNEMVTTVMNPSRSVLMLNIGVLGCLIGLAGVCTIIPSHEILFKRSNKQVSCKRITTDTTANAEITVDNPRFWSAYKTTSPQTPPNDIASYAKMEDRTLVTMPFVRDTRRKMIPKDEAIDPEPTASAQWVLPFLTGELAEMACPWEIELTVYHDVTIQEADQKSWYTSEADDQTQAESSPDSDRSNHQSQNEFPTRSGVRVTLRVLAAPRVAACEQVMATMEQLSPTLPEGILSPTPPQVRDVDEQAQSASTTENGSVIPPAETGKPSINGTQRYDFAVTDNHLPHLLLMPEGVNQRADSLISHEFGGSHNLPPSDSDGTHVNPDEEIFDTDDSDQDDTGET